MPQEFQVLRCVNCEKFQAHHTKKAKKWICKVCGEKQSYIRIYFTGPARQCRSIVQENNFEAGERRTAKILEESPNYFSHNNYTVEQDELDDEQISYSHAAKKFKSEMDGSETTEDGNSFWEDDSFFNESCVTDECYNQENMNEKFTENLDSMCKSLTTVRTNSNELASITCDKNGSHLKEVLQLKPENLDLPYKQQIIKTNSNELDSVTYNENESHLKLEVPKIKPHFVKNRGFQKILQAAEKLN